MAGKSIYSKAGVQPGNALALHAHVVAKADRDALVLRHEAHGSANATRSHAMGAAAAAHFAKAEAAKAPVEPVKMNRTTYAGRSAAHSRARRAADAYEDKLDAHVAADGKTESLRAAAAATPRNTPERETAVRVWKARKDEAGAEYKAAHPSEAKVGEAAMRLANAHGIAIGRREKATSTPRRAKRLEARAEAMKARARGEVSPLAKPTPPAAAVNPDKVRPDFAEHRAARVERMEARAGKLHGESASSMATANRISERFWMGQPILVGHHSEKGARRDQTRMHAAIGKSIQQRRAAEALASRAQFAAKNKAISSDDPHAVSSLKVKLAKLEHDQASMTAANKAIRSAKGDHVAAHAALVGLGHKPEHAAKLLTKDFAGRIGFPDYATKNNGAEIRRLKGRIDELTAHRAAPTMAEKVVHGVRIHEGDNRVRLSFGGKPPEHVRGYLKSNGFKWSPSNDAWQRQSSSGAHYHAQQAAELMAGAGG